MGSWQTETICVILRSCRDAGVVAVIKLFGYEWGVYGERRRRRKKKKKKKITISNDG